MANHKLVQSVIFKKSLFTPAQAISWLQEHEFKNNGIHTTENYHRFRQFDPDYTNPDKMFVTVKSSTPGIKFIVFVNRSDVFSD